MYITGPTKLNFYISHCNHMYVLVAYFIHMKLLNVLVGVLLRLSCNCDLLDDCWTHLNFVSARYCVLIMRRQVKKKIQPRGRVSVYFNYCNACTTIITLIPLLHQLQHHSHHRFVLLHRHLLLSLLQLKPIPIELETLLSYLRVLPLLLMSDLRVLPLLLNQERNVRLCGRRCFSPLWCYCRFIT